MVGGRGDNEGVPEHVWVHPWKLHTGPFGKASQPSGGAVPVHPGTSGSKQNRPGCSVADRPFDGSADSRGQWDEDDLVALSAHSENAVTVLFADVLDVAPGGLEDPQPE